MPLNPKTLQTQMFKHLHSKEIQVPKTVTTPNITIAPFSFCHVSDLGLPAECVGRFRNSPL